MTLVIKNWLISAISPRALRSVPRRRWSLSTTTPALTGAQYVVGIAALLAGVGLAFPQSGFARTPPDGRAYEMVSAPDKNGSDATAALTSSRDGNRLAYYSSAGFAGSEANNGTSSYLAMRGGDGWATRPVVPKVGVPGISTTGWYYFSDFTQDLSKAITISRAAEAEPNVANVFATALDGSVSWLTAPTVAGTPINEKAYAGRSADGSHIVFESSQQFSAQATGPGRQIWERVDGQVRLVSILPDGTPAPEAAVGSGVNGSIGQGLGFSGTPVQPDAVSEDGSRIFFGLGGGGSTQGVFVRIDGSQTRELSLSQRAGSVGQSSGAVFVGASADGNLAVFISPDRLTDDATPNGGIYAFDLMTGVLRFVSAGAVDPNGAQAEGLALVSHAGQRVYFVAQSVLVSGKGVAGGHNLYVWDKDENNVSYIATLGSDDAQNWQRNFGGTSGQLTTKATPDGRFFVFQSWERITATDNAGHQEIYLYDADLGTIACVSCGQPGRIPEGDASVTSNPVPRGGSILTPQIGRPRTITDDGSRVFFQTTDSLVPEDVNHRADVYEYWTATGSISLISAGTGGYDSEIADNSPDGNDVFFSTRDSLVKRDIDDGAKDVYDARVGGGFSDPTPPSPCAGEACQPLAKSAPAPVAPGTTGSASGTGAERRGPALYVHRITATGRRNAIKTGHLTLVISAEVAGTVRAAGTASYGKHTVFKLKSASARIKAGGEKNLHISLPSAVRSRLKHHHSVTLAITVSHDKATSPVRVALTLR